MRHIFTTNKRENFAKNTSTPITVFLLLKKVSRLVGIYLKKLGRKSLFNTSATVPPYKSIDDIAVDNDTDEKHVYVSQANEFHQLFHVKAKLAPDTGSTVMHSTTSTKTYQIASTYNEQTRQWVPCLTDSDLIQEKSYREDDPPLNSSFFRGVATVILLILFSVSGVSANKFATVDLSLRSVVNNSNPTLGASIKYTLWLKNEGTTTANTIVVKNNFPISGVTLTANTGGVNFTYVAGTGVGTWNIATLAAGDSVSLELTGTVNQRGTYFNIAEINSISSGDTDSDSTPGNNNLSEDDITTACISVPLLIYPGEQYTVFVPSAYKSSTAIQWFRNGVLITSSTPEATVNSDTSLVIKAIGNYTFNTGTTSACGPQGCCPIQVVAGPYGSIGDLVWKDKNDNGIQESGEPGIKNIIVELYTMNGSGQVSATPVSKDTTDNSGHYLFTGLLSGDYVVKIPTSNLSDTLKISKKKDVGSDDTKDNDFNASTGFSTKVTIHVDSTGNKRDNLTIDAALYTPIGSIGGLAWNDGNNDGIRGDIEIGVNNVVVELYSADAVGNPVGAALARDTTNVDGIYRFTNLIKRAYVVKVLANTLPEGSVVSSKKNLGGDIRKDNDFNNTTGLSGRIVLDPENDTVNPLNKDNHTIDVAVFNPLGSIGDFVWRDADNDGIQDIDEVGIKGVRLRLYTANTDGTPTGNALKTDTTDSHGYYLFSNLVLGDYVVAIDKTSLPTGATLSTMVTRGSNDKIDSDFNATTGYSGKISIDPTVQTKKDILSIDAAVYLTCPTLTVSTTDNEICVGDSIFIKGVTSNNASVKWYLSAINGTPSFTTSSNTNHLVFPTTTTTYYAEIDGSHPSCPNLRQPVTIVVNARPSLPACSCVIDECANKTVNLNDYVINGATTPGGIFQWRTTASEKSPLVANPSAVNAGVYYLFEKSGAGCFSPPRMVTVNHKNCDTLIDLSLTKIVSKAAPKLWETIIYSIKVTNAGPHAATNVEVEDQMPTDLEFLSSSFFTKNGNILTAKISNIAAGQTITLDYLARPRTLGEKINFAQITKADQKDIDSTPGNASTTQEDDNSKVIISPIQEEVFADLSLDKTVNKSAATTGEQITFYVTVLNDGSSQATNVEVRDIVPDGLQVLNATGGDSISISGNTVTAKFKTIGVGFASTFQIVARVTATSGTIKNWAQITKSDQKDNDSTPGNGTGNGEDDTDFADVTISAGVCNPPTPLIATSTPHICSGESVTLTSIGCTGTVVWSTGATGNTITVTPTLTTTYTAKCKITDTCISGDANPVVINLNVITPPLITSNVPGNTICAGGSVTLTASSCSGSVIWSNNTTASSITVSPTATTNYTAVCKTNTCTSSPSTPISITVGTTGGTTPTITASKNAICNGETVVLTASPCTGSLTWSNGTTGTSISIKPTTTGTYSATCASNGCGALTSAPVTITVSPGIQTPIISASRDTVCAGGNVNLTVSNCTGTLLWSTGVSSSVIAVSPAITTVYEVTCSSGQCSAKASKSIIVKPQPAAPVITSAKAQICAGESVVLTANNCDGKVTWSTGATTATITVNPIITTAYTATCNVNGCNSVISAPVSITVSGAAPTITASKDSICVGGSSVLTVAGCTGTLLWSNGQTTSSITVNPTATLTYTVTCKTATCETSASKTIRVSNQTIVAPVISASNTNLCTAGNVSLTASGCTGSTVIWSNLQTGTSITVNVTTNIVYAAACKIGDCESEKSNNINITVGTLTKPVISTTQATICTGSSTTLSSTGCNGQVIWSNGLTGSSVTVNPVTTTEYTAVCKALQGECTSDQSNKLQVTVTSQLAAPTITTTSSTICKTDTITLSAAGCAGTFTWSSGQTSSSIVVSPDTTTSYTVKCKLGTCESAASAVTTITVGIPTAPVISAKKTQICGGNTTQLEATGCIGSVKWSDGQIGAFINVSPGTTTTYTAVCNVGKCESVKSNAVTIQVTSSALAKPVTKDLVNTCPFTQVDLTTGVTSTISSVGGTFTFRRVNNPDSATVANPSAVGTGTYYVFEKSGNGCFSEGSRINVQIINCNDTISCITSPAMVNAGRDTTLCVKTDFFTLNGKKSGAAQSTRWTTDGTGTFDNSLSLTARYSYSNQDITRGFVNFVLTSNDPDGNGPCKAAVDTVKLTLNGISGVPTIISNKAPNICGRDSVILTITQANARVWSTGDTTRSIVVKNSGTYSVRYRNAQGCTSLSSNAITVVANDTIVPPTILATAKNVCPAKTVNLSTAVTSSPRTTGGVFEFRTGATVTSSLVTTPTAVGAGTYYVFEKSAIGCYSRSSPILVRIDSCSTPPADTVKAELGITIVGSRTEGQIGDVLTYTITVTNNTIKTATNVHITNVLPRGLTITSTTPGLTPFGTDSLISVIGTFPGGAVKTYTYTAKTTKAGIIRNIAKITKLDQVDPILSNNSSYWDVRCLSCQETCVGVALAADTVRQTNGSYNVAFRAFLESCGNVKLENVKITENLATMFPSPVTFTIVQKPTVGVGSKIIPNPNFNGSTDLNLTIPTGSILEQNIIDTVKFVVNIVPNGNQGPFSTNARVDAVGNTAFGIAQEVSDISNSGVYIDKPSAEPTVVRLFKSPSIGLAKIVSDSTKKANGSYDVTYRLFVKNNGSLPLTNVVLTDTLSKVFKLPATFTVLGAPIKNTGSQLVINSAFNGTTDTRLTLPASTIPVGQTDTLDFKVNLQPDTIKVFANTAVVNARGTLASGTNQDIRDLSNAGTNPDVPGSNPTILNLDQGGGMGSIEIPCIGVILSVKDTVKQADGTYNIIFQSVIQNCGNLTLSNVQLCDTLANTFPASLEPKIVQQPTVNAGSQLVTTTNYDGVTNTCLLASNSVLTAGKADTVKWTVNIKLGPDRGRFTNSVVVSGRTPAGLLISNTSSTNINFSVLPEALIGISKEASKPVKLSGNTYDVTFKFNVKNYGRTALTNIQVQDNLSATFGDSVRIDSVRVTADAGFTVNSNYTGRGSLINLLVDSLSTLPVNATRSITLFTRITLAEDINSFANQALAIGKYPTNKTVDDLSTDGPDPDPDGDGNPKNNSISTPVVIDTFVADTLTVLGIAKEAILDTIPNADDSYNLTYRFVIKNYSTRTLKNIQLRDSLGQVFADSSNFIIAAPITLSAGSTLKLNGEFNGRTTATMLIADSSSLAPGKADTLEMKLRIVTDKKQTAVFANSAYGSARDSSATVTDISHTGKDPDPDGDGNPGNNNAPTLITLSGDEPTNPVDTTTTAVIPGGFSPNGDGVGDKFFIKNINKTNIKASIYIYNRWGALVYKNEDFGKSDGWDAKANNGILIMSDGKAVPDGTYYYVIQAEGKWGGKPQIGFITIAR